MGLMSYGGKKYITIVGLPSGETMVLPMSVIRTLLQKGLLWKEAIFDGEHRVVYYVFSDSLMERIEDVLGDLDADEW